MDNRNLRCKVIPGYITASSPISHQGDEKTGSESLLRRMSYIINDKKTEIPILSGNAIRAGWK